MKQQATPSRLRPLCGATLAILLLVGACGSSTAPPDETSAPGPAGSVSETPVTTSEPAGPEPTTPPPTATPIPTPTAAPTPTPAPAFVFPATLDRDGLQASIDQLEEEGPAFLVATENLTSANGNDERITTTSTVVDGASLGEAEFRGVVVISSARAAGNIDLAEVLLDDGVRFSYDGDGLVRFDRAVAVAWDVGVTPEGPDVSVRVDQLTDQEQFVLKLLTPFWEGFDLTDPALDGFSMVEEGGTSARYENTVEGTLLVLELSDTGAMMSLTAEGQFPGIPGSRFQSVVSFEPLDEAPEIDVAGPDHEDVTDALEEYARIRLEASPANSGG